jgi:hypothetical protein
VCPCRGCEVMLFLVQVLGFDDGFGIGCGGVKIGLGCVPTRCEGFL